EAAVPAQEVWPELRPLLDRELERLPNDYRAAVVLCDLEGTTRRDAARRLGWPEGTLSTRLTRARALLAKRLARHGLALSAGALTAVLSPAATSACVPAPLPLATARAATLVAVGRVALPGVVSAQVATLTEGVFKAMSMTKIKLMIAGLVLASLCGT